MSLKKFSDYYIPWRKARINKLILILGKNWFRNKTILELACGYGHVGKALRKMGAIVTQTEGRTDYAKKSNATILDQDKKWSLNHEFDLVIHWGVLYHLDNWRRDLKTAIRHGKIIALESEVVDSDDPNLEIKINEWWYDGALNEKGTRPSVAAIEKCITDTGSRFKRYDDLDLDVVHHCYSWKSGEFKNRWHVPDSTVDNRYKHLRRFWIIYKK